MIDTKTNGIELGHKIAEPIFTRDGHLLLNKGTIVSYEILSKLKKHNINYYQTLNDITKANQPEALVDEETMTTSVTVVKSVFDEVMSSKDKGVKSSIPEDHINMVVEIINSLMDVLYGSEDLLYTVTELIKSDDYTYRHSVNVTILSILTAKSMHYSEAEIREIALGALLHDIGKALVTDGLIQKQEKLNDEETIEIKKHPQLGYDLIKDMDSLPNSVKNIVYLHHEKLDGSGYPNGVGGLEIPKYVRLVTVCDMYDAMTTNRIYRKKMPIYTALEILMKDAVYKIDADIYRQMTSTICLYPTGQGVLLSDGRVGVVSKYRHSSPTRPNIKIIDFDITDHSISIKEIDLQVEKTLFIVDTWNVDDFSNNFKNMVDKDSFVDLSDEDKEYFNKSISQTI